MKQRNPIEKIKQERIFTSNAKRLPHVLTKEELRKFLLHVTDVRMVLVVFFGIFLGLRIGEIIRLKWEHIDLERKVVRIVNSKNPRRFKSGYGKDRLVPIMKEFVPFIRKMGYMYPDTPYVIQFPGNKPREYENIKYTKSVIRKFQELFTETLNRAGLKQVDYYQKHGVPRYTFRTHTLRHVCGCNLRYCGMRIEDIRDFLGHAKIEDTLIYAELTKDDLSEQLHRAMNYPKQRSHMPQMETPSINVMPDAEMMKLMNENLRLMKELRIGGGLEVQNASMPQ